MEAKNGLFYLHPTVNQTVTSNVSKERVLDYCFVSTVADNEKKYHHREVAAAKTAGKIHRSLGRPAQKIFESAIFTNQFKNCPINVADVKRYFAIYGPDIASLQGKTVKRTSTPAKTLMPTSLPPSILQHHREITLCANNFFVQGIPFFHSISSKLQFLTATQLNNRSNSTLLKQFRTVQSLYAARGFVITDLRADS